MLYRGYIVMEDELLKKVQQLYLAKVIDALKAGVSKEIVVKGYSMVPTIQPFQRVKISPCEINSVSEGEIVAYKIVDHPWITVHRAIKIDENGGKRIIRTKGDHMLCPDNYEVTADIFLGIVSLMNS